jgi:hypothetical protein
MHSPCAVQALSTIVSTQSVEAGGHTWQRSPQTLLAQGA